MGVYKDELESIKSLAQCRYTPPLPRKKQRVTARAERCGKCIIYTQEQRLLYALRRFKNDQDRV